MPAADAYKNSWGVRACDTEKTSYEAIRPDVNGYPVRIMAYAFAGCTFLKTFPEIPETIIDMQYAFKDCKRLTDVSTLPEKVKNLDGTFFGCSKLKIAPEIPASVLSMNGTFAYCSKLEESPDLSACSALKSLDSTFRDCKKLRTINALPDAVTNMHRTFANCVKLKSIDVSLPQNVTTLTETFKGCKQLEVAPAIPKNVTNMTSAFSDCYNLKTPPELPEKVISIEKAFYNCVRLTSYPTIPAYVKNMRQVFDFNNTRRLSTKRKHIETITINGNPNEYANWLPTDVGAGKVVTMVGSSNMLELLKEETRTKTFWGILFPGIPEEKQYKYYAIWEEPSFSKVSVVASTNYVDINIETNGVYHTVAVYLVDSREAHFVNNYSGSAKVLRIEGLEPGKTYTFEINLRAAMYVEDDPGVCNFLDGTEITVTTLPG